MGLRLRRLSLASGRVLDFRFVRLGLGQVRRYVGEKFAPRLLEAATMT